MLDDASWRLLSGKIPIVRREGRPNWRAGEDANVIDKGMVTTCGQRVGSCRLVIRQMRDCRDACETNGLFFFAVANFGVLTLFNMPNDRNGRVIAKVDRGGGTNLLDQSDRGSHRQGRSHRIERSHRPEHNHRLWSQAQRNRTL